MVYFDNAATTGHKPQSVQNAVQYALSNLSANPGRGGHAASFAAGQAVFDVRKKAADFFHLKGEENVVFTPSCTFGLNMILKGILRTGDRVLISSMEHNAVARPIFALEKAGVTVDVAEIIFNDTAATVRAFENQLYANTKAVVCMHSSNVTGEVFPIEQIGKLCQKRGIIFVVDAAQTTGVLPIDMEKMNIDYLAIAPHKGLYAPMGVGMILAKNPPPYTIIEGGTGMASARPTQPADLPERLEPGTVNVSGILGIGAGIDFVQKNGMEKIYGHELNLAQLCYQGLSKIGNVILYTPFPEFGKFTPVISFNLRNLSSNEVAEKLDRRGICVRGGLHCAPSAHKRLGTLDSGTVRISFSAFNRKNEVVYFLQTLKEMG